MEQSDEAKEVEEVETDEATRAIMTQTKFIAILFNDCGFSPAQARDYLEQRYRVRHADELHPSERSKVIDDLRARKVASCEHKHKFRDGVCMRCMGKEFNGVWSYAGK